MQSLLEMNGIPQLASNIKDKRHSFNDANVHILDWEEASIATLLQVTLIGHLIKGCKASVVSPKTPMVMTRTQEQQWIKNKLERRQSRLDGEAFEASWKREVKHSSGHFSGSTDCHSMDE